MKTAAVPARDAWIAAGCTALVLVAFLALPALDSESDVRVPPVGGAAWWACLVVLLAQGAALLARTARPAVVLVVVAAAVPTGAACDLADAIGLTSLAVLVAVYTLVLAVPLHRAWPTLVAAGVLVAAGHLISRLRVHTGVAAALGDAVLQALGAVGAPLLVALFVVARRDTQQARESQLLAVAREREARLQAAVSHERMAMARELHDIAAHHLSGIAVMTAAIGAQIDTDPAGAKQAVAQVRQQSRALLGDLRSLVGLLREDTPTRDVTVERQQTLAGLTELVDDAASAGMAVQLSVLAAPADRPLADGVGPLAQLAAYRLVQESLANAARHAPGAPCRVVLDDRDDTLVRVSVTNEPADGAGTARSTGAPVAEPGGGFGLVGMRERAELTGAELAYGPTPTGGWQVTLTMPRLVGPDTDTDTDTATDAAATTQAPPS